MKEVRNGIKYTVNDEAIKFKETRLNYGNNGNTFTEVVEANNKLAILYLYISKNLRYVL